MDSFFLKAGDLIRIEVEIPTIEKPVYLLITRIIVNGNAQPPPSR